MKPLNNPPSGCATPPASLAKEPSRSASSSRRPPYDYPPCDRVAGFRCSRRTGGRAGPKPVLTASQQQQLFQKNREMIETLVDSSLEISNQSGDYAGRARSYGKVVDMFRKELENAAKDENAARITELGNHLNIVLHQGLAPSLKDADRQIGAGGTGREALVDIRDRNVQLVDWLQNQARNKWADSPEVREVIKSLEKTKTELGSSVAP